MDSTRHTEKFQSPVLLIVGELNVDLIFERVNELPTLETERVAEDMSITLGGSSGILAANAAALGVQVAFVGIVGDDMFGELLCNVLDQRGVDTSHINTSREIPTGATMIYTHGASRGMITYPGSMEELTIDHIPWEYLEQAQHLHVSSFYLQKGLRPDCKVLFERAKDAGLSTSLDTNWDPDERWGEDVLDVLEAVDVFLPNDDEARLISGREDLNEAMEEFARRGCTVVVTQGAEGVTSLSQEQKIQVPGLPIEPIDAVGAGDSFNAGFLQQYIQHKPLSACLQQGLLSGAFSTQEAGGIQAFDDVPEFRAFKRQHQDHFNFDASISI